MIIILLLVLIQLNIITCFISKLITLNNIRMSTTTTTILSSSWNAEKGYWMNNEVPGISLDEFPSPLYIFGYGSLLWKPEILKKYKSYKCSCYGNDIILYITNRLC